MPDPLGPSFLRRRGVLVYIFVVAVPTLALLALGLASVARQQRALEGLALADLSLQGARIAESLENRLFRLAEDCLIREVPLEELAIRLGNRESAQGIEALDALFAEARERCAGVEEFFVLVDATLAAPRRVIYPPLHQLSSEALGAVSPEDPAGPDHWRSP